MKPVTLLGVTVTIVAVWFAGGLKTAVEGRSTTGGQRKISNAVNDDTALAVKTSPCTALDCGTIKYCARRGSDQRCVATLEECIELHIYSQYTCLGPDINYTSPTAGTAMNLTKLGGNNSANSKELTQPENDKPTLAPPVIRNSTKSAATSTTPSDASESQSADDHSKAEENPEPRTGPTASHGTRDTMMGTVDRKLKPSSPGTDSTVPDRAFITYVALSSFGFVFVVTVIGCAIGKYEFGCNRRNKKDKSRNRRSGGKDTTDEDDGANIQLEIRKKNSNLGSSTAGVNVGAASTSATEPAADTSAGDNAMIRVEIDVQQILTEIRQSNFVVEALHLMCEQVAEFLADYVGPTLQALMHRTDPAIAAPPQPQTSSPALISMGQTPLGPSSNVNSMHSGARRAINLPSTSANSGARATSTPLTFGDDQPEPRKMSFLDELRMNLKSPLCKPTTNPDSSGNVSGISQIPESTPAPQNTASFKPPPQSLSNFGLYKSKKLNESSSTINDRSSGLGSSIFVTPAPPPPPPPVNLETPRLPNIMTPRTLNAQLDKQLNKFDKYRNK